MAPGVLSSLVGHFEGICFESEIGIYIELCAGDAIHPALWREWSGFEISIELY